MVERFSKKKVEVVIEQPALNRLLDALNQAECAGWSILPVNAGFGRSGAWEAVGMVGTTSSMALVIMVLDDTNLDAVLNAVSGVLARHIGIVTVTDCEVLRPERFPKHNA
ncbi:MAG: DUF190 domain-containing protein [Myxococcota bacterium]